MKLTTYSKKELKDLNGQLMLQYGCEVFDKKDSVVLQDEEIILRNKDPAFFFHEKKLVPLLKFILKHNFSRHMKTCVVDMGAIKFVCGGADAMRPGIVQIAEGI